MSGLKKALRVLCLLAAGAAFFYAVTTFDATRRDLPGWELLGACLVLCVLWQWRVNPEAGAPTARPVEPGGRVRAALGGLLALGGAALFVWASLELHHDWQGNFDKAWLGWLGGASVLAIGLDFAWGRWPSPSGLWSRTDLALALGLFAAGAALRFYGLSEFPGPYHVTQIEEMQIGAFGAKYLQGNRVRWEFLSHMWLSALGQNLFTNDLVSVRIPFVAVNSLKLIPLYFWLRWLVGRPGAVAGTALLACSGWDTMLSRIPTNQNELTTATAFMLLAGPARRGRPSAYVFLGLIAGYVTYEYIAYRPLAPLVLAGAGWLSINDRSVGWIRRLFRPLLIVAMTAAMAIPLFTSRLTQQVGRQYLDGWKRAEAQRYYREDADVWGRLDRRLQRSRQAYGSLFFTGDSATVRNVDRRPVLDRVTAGFFLAGLAYALSHWASGLVPLTLAGFLVTFTGTLIMTGNFDMARAGCNVSYVHAVAGFGTAGLAALLASLLGSLSWRQKAVAAVLAGFVAIAGTDNLRFLEEYWHSPVVRKSQHLELGYQTLWLAENVRPDEQIVGLSTRVHNVLLQHDASWLVKDGFEGIVVADLWSLIEELQKRPDQDLALYISADDAGGDVADFLRTIWPQLEFAYTEHPEWPGQGFYLAHVTAENPLDLDSPVLARNRCRSPLGEFVVHFAEAEDDHIAARFPFVDRSTWPHVLRMSLWHLRERATNVTMSLRFPFFIEERGVYMVRARARAGTASVTIDGHRRPGQPGATVNLEPGVHELLVEGDFQPAALEAEVSLEWRPPGPNRKFTLMPIYRLAPPDLDCG